MFHPSDVAFVRRWSERAPGIDGWRILLEPESVPERVLVLPPGSQEPVFYISRPSVRVVIQRRVRAGGEEAFEKVGEHDTLRNAVQALCPLAGEDLQEINEELEVQFPRNRR